MPFPDEAQAPIEMHHFGCGICCQIRRSTGASLNGTRPAQMRRSAWRGENACRSMPKRARSYLLAAVAMNSMAQHAVPNGIGHKEFDRPQLMKALSLVVIHGSSPDTSTLRGSLRLNPIAELPSSTRRESPRAE